MKLGIIPAGGKAERFGHCLKDMLPVANGKLLIDRTAEAMRNGGADKILVISSKDKLHIHRNYLGDDFDYCVKQSDSLWQSIMFSFFYSAEWYFFAMPDTYYPLDVFLYLQEKEFNLGTHKTNMPKRFGVLINDQICDKCDLDPGYYQAWGVLAWTKAVVEFWKSRLDDIESFTDAFNMAMHYFGFHTFEMQYYRDMASWDDYRELVRDYL